MAHPYAHFAYSIHVPNTSLQGSVKVALLEFVENFLQYASNIPFSFSHIEYLDSGLQFHVSAKVTPEMEYSAQQFAQSQVVTYQQSFFYPFIAFFSPNRTLLKAQAIFDQARQSYLIEHQYRNTQSLQHLLNQLKIPSLPY